MRTLKIKKQTSYARSDFSKTKILIRFMVLGMTIMILALFYIWSRVQVDLMGYEIGELQKQQKEIQAKNEKLKMELSVLKSPPRIEQMALDKLHMIWPEPEHMYKIQDNDS